MLSPQEAITRALAQGVEGLERESVGIMAGTAINALALAAEAYLNALADAARALGGPLDERELEDIFRTVGEQAQDAMVRAYDELVTRREGAASATHYRQGEDRLSGGILKRALENRDFFTANSTRLSWGNIDMLDAAARHWHRVNFGAGGIGRGSQGRFSMELPGGDAATLAFDESPSAAFTMPPGTFFEPGTNRRIPHSAARVGRDAFYPVSVSAGGAKLTRSGGGKERSAQAYRGRRTRGISGANFMDVGLKELADLLPKFLQTYLEEQIDERISNAVARSKRHLTARVTYRARVAA